MQNKNSRNKLKFLKKFTIEITILRERTNNN